MLGLSLREYIDLRVARGLYYLAVKIAMILGIRVIRPPMWLIAFSGRPTWCTMSKTLHCCVAKGPRVLNSTGKDCGGQGILRSLFRCRAAWQNLVMY